MPQLAPLSWVLLSFLLFVLILVVYSSIWWKKVSPLYLNNKKSSALGGKWMLWLW